jgi:hypothetical protein
LELFEKAKAAGDQLWVIVNSDLQRELKGSKEFMLEDERLIIVSAIGIVDKALISIDKDKTQCATLGDLADKYSLSMSSTLLMGEIRIMILYQRFPFAKKKELDF